MAIRKTAKNIIIEVKSDYNLSVGGKLEKIAEKINNEVMTHFRDTGRPFDTEEFEKEI